MSRRFAASLVASASIVAALVATTHASSPWNDVGATGRPSWVHAGVERRLRLLSALPGIESTVRKQADAYFGSKGPGMSVGLVLDDGLFYSQGFGFADASKTRTPDEFTVFRAGSLSKVMTATALLTLIDDPSRHVALTDKADQAGYLPELKYVCPVWNKPCVRGSQDTGITLKHLVSHTAGLADVMEQTNANVPQWLGDLKKSWLLFKPGQYQAYSGVGIEGVGLIEQRISGRAYPDFVKTSLFAPLGMTASSMDPLSPALSDQAQKWQFSITGNSWSFSQYNAIIGGDDQAMILPAGGLATNVRDLSLFLKMWLSGSVPTVGGHPLLKAATISSAATSLFSSTAAGPKYCNAANGTNDSNNFSYSQCVHAFGFGVGWYVGASPYLQHNGDEPGLSGSNTVVDQQKKMAVTGLISTEPSPQNAPKKPQPKGLDPNFMATVTFGLLNSGEAADSATTWAGQALADGVARVLYLSGKSPSAADLDNFEPAFAVQQNLNQSNIAGYLTAWQKKVGTCASFRVRSVTSATEILVRFNCSKGDWDTTLTVADKGQHRIAWSYVPPPSPAYEMCMAKCSKDAGLCMDSAHGSAQKQQCAFENKQCQEACNKP